MRHGAFRSMVAALAIGLALSAAACRKPPEGAPKVLVIGGEPALVDPAQSAPSQPQAVLLNAVAQGLVRFDARGEIEPGLAETWNVSDDGLSYIFRLAAAQWPNGRRVTAHQVARILRRSLAGRSNNRLADALGAVDEVVAMTDRVIEIRLTAPRPNLLQLLAQPELAVLRREDGGGTGPFALRDRRGDDGSLRLVRTVPVPDEEEGRREEVRLAGASAADAVRAFAEGTADMVLGGTFADLPIARSTELPGNALRFDPVAGLFGLAPTRSGGLVESPEIRRLLAEAIDREALIAELGVPGLRPRARVLEPGLDGMADPVPPAWAAVPLAERRQALQAEAARQFGDLDRPVLRLWLPEGPGADSLLARLAADWGALGIQVERARRQRDSDLKLVDMVAPSTSPAWFLRRFRCAEAALCSTEVDSLLEAARAAPIAAQRSALLGEAAKLVDEQQLFIPIAAPVRWSLVSSRIQGFAGNRFAIHTLTALGTRLERERAE